MSILLETFSSFADPFPDAICLLSSDGKLLATNKAISKLIDRDCESLREMSLLDIVLDESDKVHNFLRIWSRSRHMVPGALTFDIRGKALKYNCSGFLIQPKKNQLPAIVLLRLEHREQFSRNFVALDRKINQLQKEIAERRIAEQELAKSKAEFEAMFSSIPDAAMFVDKQRKIVLCNPAVRTMFGYEVKELTGQSTKIFYSDPEDYFEQGKRRYSPDRASDQSAYEVRYRRKDGSVFWGETIGTRVVNVDNEVIGFIALIRDVTLRKDTEEELRNYHQHLERSVKERTIELENSYHELESYSYSIAHDLRAPLRSIVGFSQILAQDARDRLSDADHDHLGRIIKSASHMAELIDNILELSRVSRSEMELEELSLSDISKDICDSLDVAYPDRKVIWKIQPGLLVQGDHHLLFIVLSNLINNAWKFTKKQNEATIAIGMENRDGERVFYVRDNGVGFDMQYSKKLFGLFQRLHHHDDYEGTGVGLATVERIIKRHLGWVTIEAAPQQGATVYFTIGDKVTTARISG